MKLKRLTLNDKRLFQRYLYLSRHELSVYAFQNIFIWSSLFDIRWSLIEGTLCIFFKDKTGCFLYLPPLGEAVSLTVMQKTFEIMDAYNANKGVSRIENVEEKDLALYRAAGYRCACKSSDYLCRRRDMIELAGNKFKSKRASVNYFTKHYPFEYAAFSKRDREDCLTLYRLWARQRKARSHDPVYHGMLEDSLLCLQLLLERYSGLEMSGRVVRIDNTLKGLTFGFKLNPDTLCVLYEITDLSVKGLAQFIFRAFCAEHEEYPYINIMDDSGLKNLAKVKLSYHPARLIPAYIITRPDAN